MNVSFTTCLGIRTRVRRERAVSYPLDQGATAMYGGEGGFEPPLVTRLTFSKPSSSARSIILLMASQDGFEPTTNWLTADCSTTELLRTIMVGLNGLEPSTSRLSGVRSNQLSYRPIWSG